MKSRKLVAFDIDGTILDSNKRPLESTLEALRQLRQAGHFVTLATGRSRYLAREVIRELAFENYILCNGAAAFVSHQQVFKQTLPIEALETLIADCTAKNIDTALIQLDQAKRLTSFNLAQVEEAMHSFGSTAPLLGALEAQDDVYQALAYFEAHQDEQFIGKYPEFQFVRWHEKCVDVIPAAGSKAATILNVANYFGINQSDIISFGDGLNDKEMIREAGIGVAMGNAQEVIKSQADLITKDNDHDGIWEALKTLKLVD